MANYYTINGATGSLNIYNNYYINEYDETLDDNEYYSSEEVNWPHGQTNGGYFGVQVSTDDEEDSDPGWDYSEDGPDYDDVEKETADELIVAMGELMIVDEDENMDDVDEIEDEWNEIEDYEDNDDEEEEEEEGDYWYCGSDDYYSGDEDDDYFSSDEDDDYY